MVILQILPRIMLAKKWMLSIPKRLAELKISIVSRPDQFVQSINYCRRLFPLNLGSKRFFAFRFSLNLDSKFFWAESRRGTMSWKLMSVHPSVQSFGMGWQELSGLQGEPPRISGSLRGLFRISVVCKEMRWVLEGL